MDRYAKSREYLERAKKVTPGAAQTLSKMPARFPQGAFPVALYDGYKARVQDVDGSEYVDWIGCLGANPLGYTNDHVNQSVAKALTAGPLFSLPHYTETELAERLCLKIPCAEMVRFVNSGSEATEAAIRTARIATGRDIILTVKSGYHSWHSWFQAVKDWHPGVPESYEEIVGPFTYNDLYSFEKAIIGSKISQYDKHNVAAVILEPTLFEPPSATFLSDLRNRCSAEGILLIFDEMVTGYRWRLAGGQEYFGVTPDLATFGKGMANGLPIGMLCGKREYMQHAELISGTFGGNALSLAAANAVLDVYELEPVIETMWKRGRDFQDYFNAQVNDYSVEAVCDGYPCKPRVRFTYETQELRDKAMSLFLQITAEHGALLHPGGLNVCYTLTDQDMRITHTAITEGLNAVAVAEYENDWSALKGNIIQPVVTVRS